MTAQDKDKFATYYRDVTLDWIMPRIATTPIRWAGSRVPIHIILQTLDPQTHPVGIATLIRRAIRSIDRTRVDWTGSRSEILSSRVPMALALMLEEAAARVER